MIRRSLLTMVLTISIGTWSTVAQSKTEAVDIEAIRTEIGRITQAFIDGDIETIYRTHSQDWSGFLFDGQQVPVVGINDYMKANGIQWPATADHNKPTPNPKLHYKISDLNVTFVAPGVGVASFNLDYPWGDGVNFTKLRIMDVFAKRDGRWVQAASYTAQDPTWKNKQAALPARVSDQARQQILAVREAVWRAWFANDRAKLDELIPEETIALGSGEGWQNKEAILANAKQFADSGAKLTRLEFPRTEIQMYGNTVILYSSYLFETEKDGKTSTSAGNAIETFVRRDNRLVNTGWILSSKP